MDAAREVTDEAIGRDDFDAFVRLSELRLRTALSAALGPVDGRIAALDALSWAWEHWAQVRVMGNPVGYLYRVGRTAARRARPKPIPFEQTISTTGAAPLDTDLIAAVGGLSEQQRVIVLLVHAYGWTIRDAAHLLGVAPSTVQTHAERGLARLRRTLETSDAD